MPALSSVSHAATAAAAISRLPPPPADTLDGDVRALYEANHRENWIAALSVNGATAKRFAGYFGSLFATEGSLLPLQERELIAVIVSAINGCGLCEIHHVNALASALGDDEKARRIALDPHLAPLSAREQALVDLATSVTTDPKSVEPRAFDRLRAVGLSDAEILEAIETASWFNHTNRIFISLGVWPDEKYFDR
ncbi:peroxidase-related enzyme [Hansschlegelia plantiphila]|uniref:Alkyl hydroperoxide reductase AhpD n=1 Tax=Hansschlegelia plantiphila TaxID=374655 RepID=A0A9W6J4U6_9HYPH|nr:peroxidase-related enzyme [Hansschlegelia plantiphila]GLK69768.1 alkyl hydroperoxide reductase AhpD [Hansschlegelia plantiphila]